MMIIILSIIIYLVTNINSFSITNQQRFKTNEMINTGSLGVETKGRISAVGDLNGDQLLGYFS